MNPFGAPLAGRENGDVVGVTHEGEAALFQFPVQWVELDVSQQRRERAALRRALGALLLTAIRLAQRRPEGCSDQPQQPFVPRPAGHQAHELVVIDFIECPFHPLRERRPWLSPRATPPGGFLFLTLLRGWVPWSHLQAPRSRDQQNALPARNQCQVPRTLRPGLTRPDLHGTNGRGNARRSSHQYHPSAPPDPLDFRRAALPENPPAVAPRTRRNASNPAGFPGNRWVY